jgi:hypothetical protein
VQVLEATSERRGRFRVTRDGSPLGHMEFRALAESGAIILGDRRLTIRRKGAMSGAWLLEEDTPGVGPQVVASAEKPSAWRNGIILRVPGRPEVRLDRLSAWRSTFELTEADRRLGAIRRTGVWRRRVQAEIPGDVPPPLQLFALWMAVLLYRRDDSAAAGGASG